MTNRRQRQQGSNGTLRLQKPAYLASEEFAPQYSSYRGEDIGALKHQFPGKTFTIAKVDFFDLDDGKRIWLLSVSGFDKPFKLNNSNGNKLREAFGNDILSDWPGQEIALTAHQYNTGWGVIVDPIFTDGHAETPA